MAALNSSSKQVTSCGLCSQHLSDPRMLPCLHSFCYNCLKKHFNGEKSEQSCPTCKEAHKLSEGKLELLPKDLHASYVAQVAEYEEVVSGKSKVSCSRCGNSDKGMEFKFCCVCCKCLCSWCTKDHARCLETRQHELINIGEKKSQGELSLLNIMPHKSSNCSLHSDEILKYYCKTCSQLVCPDCVILSHSGHSYDRTEAVAESEKEGLLTVIEEAKSAASKLEDAVAKGEKVVQNIHVKQKLMDDEINKCFEELQKALVNRKRSLVARNSEVSLRKMTALGLQQEQMKKLRDEIMRVCSHATKACELYTPTEMLSAKALMVEKLNNLVTKFKISSLDPCQNEFVVTDFSMKVREEIEKFGVIVGGSYAAKSSASLYTPQAIKGKPMKFVVTTRDIEGKLFGRGGEVVKAAMKVISSEHLELGVVSDNKDGTYNVTVIPESVGEHHLSITIGNEPIISSPFVVSVRNSRSYESLDVVASYDVADQPLDVALSDIGEIIVACLTSHDIKVLSHEGILLRTIGTKGCEKLQFNEPTGIAIQGDVIYVTEQTNHRVQKLTTSGEHIAMIGSHGSGEGQLNKPYGISIDPEGKLYVSELSNNRVSVFGADGTFDHFITGEMNNPWGVAFDPVGNLHVVNNGSHKVTVYSPTHKYIREYGNSYLCKPSSIAIDPEGFVFVAEYNYNSSSSSKLHIFDPQYKLIKSITMNDCISGVRFDKEGNIFICSCYNSKLTMY